jgi:RimJ/RimL family protein N-acetyltransferase
MDRRPRLDPAADPPPVVKGEGAVAAETERLLLRNWRAGDIEPFVRHTNTEPVLRWLGGMKPPGFLEGVVRERFMVWPEREGFTFWVVERKEDGELLGFCGLKRADGRDSPVAGEIEIGWRLREDAWGQGYAKEAASAALDFAFGAAGAERVIALTVEGNEASWGLMRRLGMRRRADWDYVDPDWPPSMNPVIVYELERGAWSS